jgi:hypothetical protein
MTPNRVQNAIKIIEHAINNNIGIKQAATEIGFGETYVKNVKLDLYKSVERGIVEQSVLNSFLEIYKKYQESKISNLTKNEELTTTLKTFSLNDNSTKLTFKEDEAELEHNTNSNYPPNHIKTLEELLQFHKIDLNFWNVKEHTINKWDVTSFKNDNPQTIQNFQVKARLEKKVDHVKYKQAAEVFLDMIKNYSPPTFNLDYKKLPNHPEHNLLEISIFDLHLGKLCWEGETGENYDVKIASKRFLQSINELIQESKGFEISKILFPIGNDFFNSDTINNTTTKGTQQDEDLRWQKTFTLGVTLLVDGINLLKTLNVPVDVLIIPGNHDFSKSYFMGSYLEAWFRNDEQVMVNNGASPRKYYKFGEVLLGFTHGNEEAENSLPLLMATEKESKPMWSETKFHEWHLGHKHRKSNIKYSVLNKNRELNEDLGIMVRYLSSLTGTEEWHHRKGFVGQIKAADGFIWNNKTGLRAHLNTNYIIEN